MRLTKLIPAALVAVVLAPALPVQAGSFTPPQGCQLFMTVQSRACRVSNHYKCTQDAPGDQWRADFDQEGKFFESKIDAETQWIESHEGNPPIVQTLDPGAVDPASFSELLSTGMDTFEFGLSRDSGEQTRVTGYDRLTGKSYVIDGVDLQETEFEFTESDTMGNVLRRSRGNEYINPEMRMFFAGRSDWEAEDGSWLPMDGTPRQFIFPGQKGFGSTQPIFDCDPVMSSLPTPVAPRG